jgi:IS30 family transposase
MPRYPHNKMPAAVKGRYFELIRTGLSGSAAAQEVGVSLSCGSVWFIDAGRVSFVETPISPRFLSQDDRIAIADGLARGEPVKQIAARIGKCYHTVYRELARNRKVDGRYQPWFAHNQAHLRRHRAKLRRFAADDDCARSWPASSPNAGRRRRSAVGFGDAIRDVGTGGCAPRRSMRRSIGV